MASLVYSTQEETLKKINNTFSGQLSKSLGLGLGRNYVMPTARRPYHKSIWQW